LLLLVDEISDLSDKLRALEIIRFLLRLDHIFVGLAHDGNQQVEHDDCDDEGAAQVEDLHEGGGSELRPVHVVCTQANQVGLVQEVPWVQPFRRLDVESEGEGAQNEQVEEAEDANLVDDVEEHVDEEASIPEDAQEVEDLQPHAEADNAL